MIEFEGIEVRPNKQGQYRCPFKCGRSDYPQPTWKTEKGFRGHMEKCKGKPSTLNAKRKKEFEIADKKRLKAIELSKEIPFKEGDTIHFVREVIVKPEREYNDYLKKWVRKRYEAVKRFDPITIKVESIEIVPERVNPFCTSWMTVTKVNGYFVSGLWKSEQECKRKAEQMQNGYEKYCREAESYR